MEKQQLQEALRKVERDELIQDRKNQLKYMHDNVGKGYASHSLNTYMNSNKPSYEFTMYWVHEVIGEVDNVDEPLLYNIQQVNIRKCGTESFHINISTTNNKDIPFWLGGLKYSITFKQFNHFMKSFIPKLEVSIDKLRHEYKQGLLISNGDSGGKSNKVELLTKIGHSFIDMTQESQIVWENLEWRNHPYLYGDKLLKTKESIEIVNNIAEGMREHAVSWGDSILERDSPRFQALFSFYRKYRTKWR